MPKVDFRQFQEWEAQNDDSLATTHIQRRCAEVGMEVAYHLGDRLGALCDGLGKWHSRSEILAATDNGFEMTCHYHKT